MNNFYTLKLFLFSILLMGGVSCIHSHLKKPSGSVSQLYTYLTENQLEKAAQLYVENNGEELSEKGLDKVKGILALSSVRVENNGGIEQVAIMEEKIAASSKQAWVSLKIYYKNGKIEQDKITLIKRGSDWYITLPN